MRVSTLRKQALGLIAARLGAAFLQALLIVLLGREVAPAQFGTVALIQSLLGYAMTVADFGTPPFLSRAWARRSLADALGAVRLNRATTLSVTVIGGLATAAVLLLVHGPVVLALLAVAAGLEKNTEASLSIPIAERDIGVTALNLSLRRGLGLVVFLAFVFVAGPSGALVAYTVASLCGAGVGQVHIATRLGRYLPTDIRATPRVAVLRRSVHFGLGNITAQVRALDVTIVGAMAGAVQAGYYSSASRLTSPLALVPSALAATALPHAARLNRAEARRFTGRLLLLHAAMVLALVPVALVSPWIIRVLYGAPYASAAPVLSVLLIAAPIFGLSSVLGSVAQGQFLERLVSINGLTFAVLTVLVLVLGAVLLGAFGTAIALVVAYVAKCVPLVIALARVPHSAGE